MTPAFPKPERKAKPRRPLKRKTWMRKSRPRRLSRAGADLPYLAFVRGLRCATESGACWGPIHAHHAIHRSQGGKDADAVPLCLHHHADWHNHRGPFGTMSRLERFAWSMRAIAETQATYRGAALRGMP